MLKAHINWRVKILLLYLSFIIGPLIISFMSQYSIIPSIGVCLIKVITGHACPFCGLTRSISSSLLINFNHAATFHPFGIVVTMYFLCVILYLLLSSINKGTNYLSWGLEAKILSLCNNIIVVAIVGEYCIKTLLYRLA